MVKDSMEQKGQCTAQQNAGLQIIERKCVKCKKVKPRNEFHKSKSLSGGIHYTCKKCRNDSRRKTSRLDNICSVPKGMIYCSSCNQCKKANYENFYKSKLKSGSRHLTCISCRRKKSNINRKNKLAECRERHTKWRSKNKGHVRAYSKQRKKLVIIATPSWFEKDLVERVYIEAADRGWHVDHIVPLKSNFVCGLHCHANLQILEPKINMSKKNRYWPDMP